MNVECDNVESRREDKVLYNENVKISVVVPVYNGEKYIGECLESLIGQTLREIEIIVVDAGSTDGTVDIIDSYIEKDKRVRILCSEKKSMGYQYNIGIADASGKYIGFCESDDCLAEGMLEKLYNIAEEKDVDYIKSSFQMFVDKETRIFMNYNILAGDRKCLVDQIIRPSDYPDVLYRDVNMWNGIYRRDFLQSSAIKLNETPKAAFQDTGFAIQTFLSAKKAIYVEGDSYQYRRDNISSSVYDPNGVINVVQEAEFALKYMKNYPRNTKVDTIVCNRFLSLFFGFLGRLPVDTKEEEVMVLIDRFKSLYLLAEPYIPYYAKQEEYLNTSLSLKLLLTDPMRLWEFRKTVTKFERDYLRDFYQYLSEKRRIVIFGAGEMGTSLCALLLNNSFEGDLCFCDNDHAKWGKLYMGLTIRGLTELKKYNETGDTCFVIAAGAAYYQIKKQLAEEGIPCENICQALNILPHSAMEIIF